MSEGNNNKWLYILGGLGALVAGAVAYHYYQNGSEAEEEDSSALKTELDKIGTVEREANGAIKLNDFINLFKVITKHAKVKIGKVKADYASKR